MKIQSIPIRDTPFFNKLIRDYIFQEDGLDTFIHYKPELASLALSARDKASEVFDREGLHAEIKRQYAGIEIGAEVNQRIELLKSPDTYCVITAHQLNIFTGPYYYIHKILSAIKTAELSNSVHEDFKVVPIFVMGSEDHDKEEIASIHLFNKKYTWETEQTGATGRFLIDDSFLELMDIIIQHLRNEKLIEMLKMSYQKGDTLAFAQRKLIHALFADYGLIIVDLDAAFFKKSFLPIAEDEVEHQRAKTILASNLEKLAENYSVQAYPRDINIFKLTGDERKYIESAAEIKQLKVEDISPNVIFRPLMQQKVLPSLCYIGGGGELAYWLELKPLFDYYQVNYPLLMLRNHAILIDAKSQDKFEGLGFHLTNAFEHPDVLKKKMVQADTDIEATIADAQKQLANLFENVEKLTSTIDDSLITSIKADETRAAQIVQAIEQKLIKAAKKKNEDKNQFIEKYHQKIMPEGNLQERHENFMQYYDKMDNVFIETLYKEFQPFSKEILFLQY